MCWQCRSPSPHPNMLFGEIHGALGLGLFWATSDPSNPESYFENIHTANVKYLTASVLWKCLQSQLLLNGRFDSYSHRLWPSQQPCCSSCPLQSQICCIWQTHIELCPKSQPQANVQLSLIHCRAKDCEHSWYCFQLAQSIADSTLTIIYIN